MSSTAIARPHLGDLGLRKYVSMTLVSIQDAFTYRANAAVWMVVDFVPAVVMILVWIAAYSGRREVEGYNLPQMVTYYLLSGIIAGALTSHAEFTMNWEIRDGRLTPQLSRPINYPVGVMCRETGWIVAKCVVGLPVFALLIFLFRRHFLVPQLSPVEWLGAATAMVFSYVILSEIGACLGCISLWTIEASGVFELWWSMGGVLSGSLLPLELLPGPLRALANVMPHQWGTYFPVRVLLGKGGPGALWEGLFIQAGWIAGLAIILGTLWRLGTRKYEGWGG
jgi:viologen exporter family transport system permease protein